MMNQESKRPVTIEDLLHLKRAERPSAEFWSEFDQELRAKQLAALVEKRPWWRSFPRALGGLARYHLPLGATAVLAVTLFSIRDYRLAAPEPPVDTAAKTTLTAPANQQDVTSVAVADASPVSAAIASNDNDASETALSSAGNAPGELSRLVPMLSSNGGQAVAEISPSERSIAVNRAVAEAMLGTPTSGFETRALPAKMTQEPLAQMSNPAETRRSRFAVAFAAAAANGSPVQTARVARRLSDEQLYDTIHRFGASGNTVSIRF